MLITSTTNNVPSRPFPRVRLALLAALLLPAAAGPETLHCPPLRAVAAPATTIPYDKGLLWKVQHGSAPPNHLFGTMHVGDRRIVDLPEPVRDALDTSRRFVMEARPDEQGVGELAAMMHYDDGTQLSAQVSAALYARTQDLLNRYGIPSSSVRTMRPWAAFVTLNQPEGELGPPLDFVLMQEAMRRGLPVHALETLREQGEVLASFSLADQVTLLRDTVCYFDQIQAEIEELKRLYLDRDLGGIVRLTQQYPGEDAALGRRVADAIVDRRNHRMVARVRSHLDEGGTFIAIGALHLPGGEGVLALLARHGYRLTRVY
ncbi:MAG: TraB/GumN family protein [Chromatiales bacterium]